MEYAFIRFRDFLFYTYTSPCARIVHIVSVFYFERFWSIIYAYIMSIEELVPALVKPNAGIPCFFTSFQPNSKLTSLRFVCSRLRFLCWLHLPMDKPGDGMVRLLVCMVFYSFLYLTACAALEYSKLMYSVMITCRTRVKGLRPKVFTISVVHQPFNSTTPTF